jgi:hypothetical protein
VYENAKYYKLAHSFIKFHKFSFKNRKLNTGFSQSQFKISQTYIYSFSKKNKFFSVHVMKENQFVFKDSAYGIN